LLFLGKEDFSELSVPLKKCMRVFQYKDFIAGSNFLCTVSPAYLEELVLDLVPSLTTPNYAIVEEGTMGSEMYFIEKGRVAISVNGNKVAVLGPGDYFGEIALLLNAGRRTAVAISGSYTNLFTLPR
jgi:CRP-like cAMP-binding protein